MSILLRKPLVLHVYSLEDRLASTPRGGTVNAAADEPVDIPTALENLLDALEVRWLDRDATSMRKRLVYSTVSGRYSGCRSGEGRTSSCASVGPLAPCRSQCAGTALGARAL
jgi:hypothetical protein